MTEFWLDADAIHPQFRSRGKISSWRSTPGMYTLHANSAREALVKACTLQLLAGDKQVKRAARGVHEPRIER